jgi:two-component system sensor kinase FixL
MHHPTDDALLAAIVESSDDAIIAKDLHGTVFAWNTAAARLFGYSAAEMVGQPITTIFPPDRVAEEAMLLARIAAGERVEHYETARRRKDGKVINVSVTISPIRDRNGNVVGASKILRDLTERNARSEHIRQLQSELAHVQRLNDLGQMVSSLVHEVNQPLTAIGNYAAAGRRLVALDEPEKLRTALDSIAEQTTRTRDIVKRIANFVRRREFAMQDEDLSLVIDEAVTLTRTFVKDTGLDLTVDMQPAGLHVLIDKIQVQQVIFNLLRNGIEAMQPQGRRALAIGARRGPTDMVEISVADSGHGLADTVRGRLFQPFVTTKDHGMGVGLSVCRSIVEAHAGRLWAEDNLGGGTVFRFTVRDAEGRQSASF